MVTLVNVDDDDDDDGDDDDDDDDDVGIEYKILDFDCSVVTDAEIFPLCRCCHYIYAIAMQSIQRNELFAVIILAYLA